MTAVLRCSRGFTLIEIITVMVILGVLAAFAIPKYFDLRTASERRTLVWAYNDMKSRAGAVFAQSLIENGGIANANDVDDWGDLGFNSLNDVNASYKDFAGTWTGRSASTITYQMLNGGAVYTFTLSAGTANQAPSINANPAL